MRPRVGSTFAVVLCCAAGLHSACTPAAGEPQAPPARESSGDEADGQRHTCALGDGTVRARVVVPEGHALARTAQTCMIVPERRGVPPFVAVSAVPIGSEGPAQLLKAEPDGVLRWARQSAVLGTNVQHVGGGTMQMLDGRRGRYYRVVGTPEGLSVRREVALLRLPAREHHVVVMAVYEPGNEDERARTLELVRHVQLD